MPTIDTERFRLRNFVDKLVEAGECEVHNAPIDLVDVGGVLDGNPRAVLFKAAGPEKAELVGNVMASRRRLPPRSTPTSAACWPPSPRGSTACIRPSKCRRSRRRCSRSCSAIREF